MGSERGSETIAEIRAGRKLSRSVPLNTCRAQASTLSREGRLPEHYDVIIIGSGPGGASARPSPCPNRKAHPDPRTRRLSAARGGELERAGRLRRRQVSSRRDMDQCRWRHLQSATPLFRGRQFQGVWLQLSSGCVSAISTRSPMPAASRQPGRSSIATSPPIMMPPRRCSVCTERAARTRPSLRPPSLIHIPR